MPGIEARGMGAQSSWRQEGRERSPSALVIPNTEESPEDDLGGGANGDVSLLWAQARGREKLESSLPVSPRVQREVRIFTSLRSGGHRSDAEAPLPVPLSHWGTGQNSEPQWQHLTVEYRSRNSCSG